MNYGKISEKHLERGAVVYVRQSTLPQLKQNQESTHRQYAMANLAEELGYRKEKIEIFDGDLGKSGTTVLQRTDFQRLMRKVIEGKVGAIFAIEISRLSRTQSHWHRLVELCIATNTLLIDYERVYDPRLHDDWFLLAFKGTWSTAELHIQWLRMQQAKRHKAKEGRLITPLPTGYIMDDRNQIIKDPNLKVQETFEIIFRKFEELGTLGGVLRYLNDNHILIPTRKNEGTGNSIVFSSDTQKVTSITWHKPRKDRLSDILKNPRYAGAYVFGQHIRKPVMDPESGDTVRYKAEEVPMEKWDVVIQDAFEAYISWEQYLQNVERLCMNRTSYSASSQWGVPREGAALLQGQIWCGKCGRPMSVHYYSTDGKKVSYNCDATATRHGNRICWSIKADAIDNAVVEMALSILNEKNLKLAVSVLNYYEAEAEAEAEGQDNHWQQEIAVMKGEAQKAEKRYKLANPEYREIVDQLEKEWHDARQALKKLEQDYRKFQSEQQQTLSQEEKDLILSLAQNLPEVWRNNATSTQDRKKMLRLMIDSVTISPIDEPSLLTHIKVLWHTGEITELFIERKPSFVIYKTPEAVIKAIEELLNLSDSEIAIKLNEQGFVSGKGTAFNASMVGSIRFKNKLKKINILDDAVLQTIKELLHLPDPKIVEELNRLGFVTSRGRSFTTASLLQIRVEHKLYKQRSEN